MTPFDFLSVIFSVVIGLGLSQLLASIALAFESRKRVVLDWICCTWAFTVFLFLVEAWWGLWALRTATSWTYASFLLLVLYQSALFIMSMLVLPRSYETERVSQAEHFQVVRPLFFSALAVVSVSAFVVNALLFAIPLLSTFAVLPVLGAIVALTAIKFSNRRYQALVAVFFAMALWR